MIIIDKNIHLARSSVSHAEALFEAVDRNRAHLSGFLPWVHSMKDIDDLSSYLAKCNTLIEEGTEISYEIIVSNQIVGRIGLHHIDRYNQHASIGYWLTEQAQGRGIIIRACRRLISYAFDTLHLNRIEILAAKENIKSQAVPQKLGFTQEGVLRQVEKVNDKLHDLVVYAVLKEDWDKMENQQHHE
ncbi:GNAT family N-acetyltransferase [Sphingobacterium lumbrici]|uniref:GNAT family N-acetyltransferase n=1 Tax=Sphingobacterium lumbrici TaxID=2559600 RepID=UPI001128CFC5|nr:GNAT family protein [Sphingobacterium lumbrici]